MASFEGISVDTGTNVHVNIVQSYTRKIITKDLRVMISQQYQAIVNWP